MAAGGGVSFHSGYRYVVTYQRSTKDSDTAREDKLWWLAIGTLVLSCRLEDISSRVDIDLHAKIEVVFGATGHDAVKAVDNGWWAELGGEDRLYSCGLAQVGFEGHVVILGDSLGGFRLD